MSYPCGWFDVFDQTWIVASSKIPSTDRNFRHVSASAYIVRVNLFVLFMPEFANCLVHSVLAIR
jgi:hypothetical protein